MRIINLKDEFRSEECYIALGYFDGMHLGHLKIIKSCISDARRDKVESAVLLLDFKGAKSITPIDDKIKILEELGIDTVYVIDFTDELKRTDPKAFVKEILLDRLNAIRTYSGEDYTFGIDRLGDTALLKEMMKEAGGEAVVLNFELDEEMQKISSSNIKKLILSGEVMSANKDLSRYYSIKSKVIHGKRFGSSVGIPTANLNINTGYIIPYQGVYVTKIKIKDRIYKSVTSVGKNLSFNEDFVSVETNIFDFDDDIYDDTVRLYFIYRIRDMLNFADKDDLLKQIKRDIDFVKKFEDYL